MRTHTKAHKHVIQNQKKEDDNIKQGQPEGEIPRQIKGKQYTKSIKQEAKEHQSESHLGGESGPKWRMGNFSHAGHICGFQTHWHLLLVVFQAMVMS